jgi:hypothetical protein
MSPYSRARTPLSAHGLLARVPLPAPPASSPGGRPLLPGPEADALLASAAAELLAVAEDAWDAHAQASRRAAALAA